MQRGDFFRVVPGRGSCTAAFVSSGVSSRWLVMRFAQLLSVTLQIVFSVPSYSPVVGGGRDHYRVSARRRFTISCASSRRPLWAERYRFAPSRFPQRAQLGAADPLMFIRLLPAHCPCTRGRKAERGTRVM